MKNLFVLFALSLLVASCSREDNVSDDSIEPVVQDELISSNESSDGDIEAVIDYKSISFDDKGLMDAVKSISEFTFSLAEIQPISNKTFTFELVENEDQNDDASPVYEYQSLTTEVELYLYTTDHKSFLLSIYSDGLKYGITNTAEDYVGKNVYYLDSEYAIPEGGLESRSNDIYEVDLWIFADKGYATIASSESRSNTLLMCDAARDAINILESQLPVDIDLRTWTATNTDHLWDGSDSRNTIVSDFRSMLDNPFSLSSFLGYTLRSRINNADVKIGYSGYHPYSSYKYFGTASILGFCGNNTAPFMFTRPDRKVYNKRTLAMLIANGLGAKLDYSSQSMMNPGTSGAAREVLNQAAINQITSKLESAPCVDIK